jgi:hypothetical protein
MDEAPDGRHADSDPGRLDVSAAQMPAISEGRIDVWDAKAWMTEQYEPETVEAQQWADRDPGCYIPQSGDRDRSLGILREAARWYGGDRG